MATQKQKCKICGEIRAEPPSRVCQKCTTEQILDMIRKRKNDSNKK